MKTLVQIAFFLVALAAAASLAHGDNTFRDNTFGDDTLADNWPRKISADGKNFTIYQPQVESWKGTDLEERIAVSVENSSSGGPVFGVIWIKARTDIDKSQRAVALQDIKVTKVNFPTEPGNESTYKQILESNAGDVFSSISLDRLRASLAINASEAKHKVDGLKNDPPEIIYSDKPAVLVLVDGPGTLRDTGTPNLERVVNTRALIVFNKADGKYNLNVADHWYQRQSLDGEWKPADIQGALLDNLNKIKADNTQDTDSLSKTPEVAAVFSSTNPAELVQSKGLPQFEPIKNTELLYVTNTPDNIFMFTGDQSYYVTLSGRWFRAKSMHGPWKFIDSDKLPPDFANIPENHPKGEILASVAGTPDAREAAIANDIPQTATVNRQTAKLAVVYDGSPNFTLIQGTTLMYARNSATPVIQVGGNTYYAVENGVWFSAPTPNGPWVVTSEVPDAIYTIPPSAPVYYVTYAYVYGADANYVYVGYLPGYLGSYVAPSGVVVFGTGYAYRPWIARSWYGYPVTYGFGCAWGFGFGWTFRPVFWGAPVYHPWWGPWPHYWAHSGVRWDERRFTVNHVNVYRSWDRTVIRPTTVRNYVATRSEIARSRVSVTDNIHRNNVYADHSGNVYRHEPQTGWQTYNNSHQWQPIRSDPKSATVPHTTMARGWSAPHETFGSSGELERERVARERGAVRTERYRAPAPVMGRVGSGKSYGGHSESKSR